MNGSGGRWGTLRVCCTYVLAYLLTFGLEMLSDGTARRSDSRTASDAHPSLVLPLPSLGRATA
ncbi:hypothetical protein C8Q76DRAFT_756921 [Earliella scabrosa]|nr:hypothetical protein C8Q76DRAFT_756921 [Earliella scabrosa]